MLIPTQMILFMPVYKIYQRMQTRARERVCKHARTHSSTHHTHRYSTAHTQIQRDIEKLGLVGFLHSYICISARMMLYRPHNSATTFRKSVEITFDFIVHPRDNGIYCGGNDSTATSYKTEAMFSFGNTPTYTSKLVEREFYDE